MKIYDRNGVFALIPENDAEGMENLSVFAEVSYGGKLRYVERFGNSRTKHFSLHFIAGSIRFRISAEDRESRAGLMRLRDICFDKSVKEVTLHDTQQTEFGIALILTARYCMECGRPMTLRLRWKICASCAEKLCRHERYEKEIIADERGDAVYEICSKCGLLNPADARRVLGLSDAARRKEIHDFDPLLSITPVSLGKALKTIAGLLRQKN